MASKVTDSVRQDGDSSHGIQEMLTFRGHLLRNAVIVRLKISGSELRKTGTDGSH